MKHNFKKHVTYVLFFFMMVVSACNDNKAEIYEPKTPIGINIANTSIVTEMIWDKKTVLKDGININELYFKTGQDHQHIFVAEVDLSKFAISPGTKDDVYLGSYTPCDATHEASTTDEFIKGYMRKDWGLFSGPMIEVIIWRGEDGNNIHCTTNLDMDTWETAKS